MITDNSKEVQGQVPIYQKVTLTIKEAAEYSNIGINRIESLLRAPRCPFVLYVGKKKLVKRKEFEKFISENIEI
ncbi:excisionase [Clostridium sp. L2-50]|uniref:excisionase n=1 Tax=Clostridium sp. L2-50 TaxID=411489 RepID=UPI00238176E5|nr:excisionase [Clostridium sp. L2-50]UEA78281.1 helix-turn-helix domain-containing protein [Lachnospiraceae bacterium GAM79]